jgi:putative ABC transport system permease protein
LASAFNKDVRRSIKNSIGRFVAILVIAALGTGFYAGLRMTSPDMNLSADTYYDATNLYDIRVASTLGIDDDTIAELKAVEGVDQVVGEHEADAIATLGGVEYAIRIHGLDVDAAVASDTSDGLNAFSDDESYINRPILVEGRWPTNSGECVLCEDAVLDQPVSIGDKVSLTKLAGDDDMSGTFDVTEYTITGFVRSSYYVCSANFGTTTLADGSVEDFMLVPDGDFADDFPYTGAFLTVEGAREQMSGSDAYYELVDAVSERINALTPKVSASRLANVKAEAQSELDDSWQEYYDSKAEAESELADAKAELDSAAADLASAKATLEQNESDLAAAQTEYENGVAELEEQRQSAESQFAAAQEQIDSQRAQLEEAMSQLGDVDSQLTQISEGISLLQSQADTLEQQIQQLESLDPTNSQLPILKATLASLQEQIAALQQQADQLNAAVAQIQEGEAELDQAQAQLDASRVSAEEKFASAQAELDAAKATIDSGRSQLASGWEEYESGLAEYQSGLQEYEDQKKKAQDELDDAKCKLDDAQKQIDEMESPEFYVLDRTKNIGAESFALDSERIDRISQVFPFIFFLVAALVVLTTMTRMVDEERVLIGTYKALGYSNSRIISKYIIYALLACGIGCIIGVAFLTQYLPYFIMEAYGIIYIFPVNLTPIDPYYALVSSGLSIAIVLIATWWAASASLREKPAALMLPRSPKAGKRILLERIRPLWSRMSFTWKVTSRNIFRYKRRFFMAIIGIAGCTALLLTGFGLSDSINDIIDKQYAGSDPIFDFNVTVRMDDNATTSEMDQIASYIGSSEDVEKSELTQETSMVAVSSSGTEYQIQLVVPEDTQKFNEFVKMHGRLNNEDIELGDDGVVVTEKLADVMGVSPGDTITIYEQNTIGNASGEAKEFKVADVSENYVSHYIYVSPTYYKEVMGEDPDYNTFFIRTVSDSDAQKQLVEELGHSDGVSTVSQSDEVISYYRKALKSVDSVVVVLTVSAAVLAFVVIYNLTNINISERSREIATLKVLGFTKREVSSYIFREVILLSIIGALVGLVFGIFLENFVVLTAEIDQVMFGRDIHAMSFLISFVLTMAYTVIVMLFMRRKLDKISMVDSLKSVD